MEEILAKIAQLRVNMEQGRVYGSRGREIGSPGSKGNRVNGDAHIYVGFARRREHSKVRYKWIKSVKKVRRSHIVWFKATGQWPEKLVYVDGNKRNDAIANLKVGDE